MTNESRETITWITDMLLKGAAGVCVALLWFAQAYLRDMAENIESLKQSVQSLAVETRLVERELKALNHEIERLDSRIKIIEDNPKP